MKILITFFFMCSEIRIAGEKILINFIENNVCKTKCCPKKKKNVCKTKTNNLSVKVYEKQMIYQSGYFFIANYKNVYKKKTLSHFYNSTIVRITSFFSVLTALSSKRRLLINASFNPSPHGKIMFFNYSRFAGIETLCALLYQ